MALQERNVNVPRNTPPSHRTPHLQCKLPRRVITPLSSAKWASTVADRVASMEKSGPFGKKHGASPRSVSLQAAPLDYNAL